MQQIIDYIQSYPKSSILGGMSTMQKTGTDDNEYIQMTVLIYFDY